MLINESNSKNNHRQSPNNVIIEPIGTPILVSCGQRVMKRINNELTTIMESDTYGNDYIVTPQQNNLICIDNNGKDVKDNNPIWIVDIYGPQGSDYEGGTFRFQVKLNPTRIFKPPTITCKTKMYHLNISSKGRILSPRLCDDVDVGLEWRKDREIGKVKFIQRILDELVEMLKKPNEKKNYCSHEPIWQEYMNDKNSYCEKARKETRQFGQCEK